MFFRLRRVRVHLCPRIALTRMLPRSHLAHHTAVGDIGGAGKDCTGGGGNEIDGSAGKVNRRAAISSCSGEVDVFKWMLPSSAGGVSRLPHR